MSALDWVVIISYMSGMIGLSIYLGRRHHDEADYYVAGRNLSWWAIGISTMATQTSAISFISKPAFMALKPGGGLTWLQFELAVPLAMIIVMAVLIPFFRKQRLISVYEYLEKRFDRRVRVLVSAVFLASRGIAAGVVIYATAIVLSVCLGLPLMATIVLIGFITVAYDTIGGMSAVVYSDVIQMFILLLGIGICIFTALNIVGGWEAALAAMPDQRLDALQIKSGWNDNSKVPLWSILFGGFFLYISYYGTDQSQVQRELSASSAENTRKSLLLNGFVRFPLTALYLLMGLAIHAVYVQSPELQAAVPFDQPDYLVPQFILLNLPSGIRALLFAAILAAAMSSLDSVLNSLSAATMRDFLSGASFQKYHPLKMSKIVTVIWGIAITALAFVADRIDGTIVEAINKIGSAFYGPVLAAFLIGVLSKRAAAPAVLTGVVTGVAGNLYLWLFHPGIYWMWWNLIGCLVTVLLTVLFQYFSKAKPGAEQLSVTLGFSDILAREKGWGRAYVSLVFYALLIFLILFAVTFWRS